MQRDRALLLDMLLACRRIARYLDGVTEDAFARNEVLQDAVVKRLEIVGEAANRVSAQLQEAHPDIPWRAIVGMRHRLIHDYGAIDLVRVWDVAVREAPRLAEQIARLIPEQDR